MENRIKQSILKTVLYADIFDYPLTSKQLWQYLISDRKINYKSFAKVLRHVSLPVSSTSGIYFIKGKKKFVDLKVKRKLESSKKFSIVYRICEIISLVPFVLLIGISGGLSMENSDKKDDIDFFIVTEKNRIWISRILVIIILKILGRHRGRLDKKVSNKICLNMLIDDGHLSFSKNKNIYTAHEISQMIPVFDRRNIYGRFIQENLWVRKFLPNALPEIEVKKITKKSNSKFIKNILDLIESIVKRTQLWYIKKNITIETIDEGFLAFHPFDYSNFIISSYEKRLKKYGQKI